jgi:hypothetical protein
LLRALDDLSGHGIVLELTVYGLTPSARYEASVRDELERIRLMTPAQIQAVRTFLKFVQDNLGDPGWNRRSFIHAFEKLWV